MRGARPEDAESFCEPSLQQTSVKREIVTAEEAARTCSEPSEQTPVEEVDPGAEDGTCLEPIVQIFLEEEDPLDCGKEPTQR